MLSIIFGTSCNSQVKTNTFGDPNISESSPIVIRNFKPVALAPDFDTTLVSQYIRSIFQDSKGNLWFGTLGEGVVRYDGKTLTEYTPKDGLGGTEFWGIYIEQSGIIWVTARGSTTRFDPSVPLPNPKAFTVFTVADGLNCCVQSMYQDKSGNMWWGAGQGLYRFDGTRFYQVKQNGPW